MKNRLELLQEKIAKAPVAEDRAAWAIASEFEDVILLDEDLGREAFQLILDIFSKEPYVSSKLPGQFARVLSTDFEKMSPAQSQKLLEVFASNRSSYSDELSRHWIADLVVRNYPIAISTNFFEGADLSDANSAHISSIGLHLLAVQAKVRAGA